MTNSGEISENINKGVGIVGIGGKIWLRLQHDTHGTYRGESTIRPGGSQLNIGIIHSGNYCGKDVRFEAARIQ